MFTFFFKWKLQSVVITPVLWPKVFLLWRHKKMREHELTNYRPSLSRARSLFLNLNLNLILCKGTVSGYSVNRWPSRKNRTANTCVWQTWQGYYLRVLSWSSHNTNVFWSFTKKMLKGKWSLAKNCFKQKLLSRLSHKVRRFLSCLPSSFLSLTNLLRRVPH